MYIMIKITLNFQFCQQLRNMEWLYGIARVLWYNTIRKTRQDTSEFFLGNLLFIYDLFKEALRIL